MQPESPSTYARWVADVRGEGRAVRVAAHVEAGFLVISTWKAGVCVGTVRLVPHEAAELVAGIGHGLAELAEGAELPVLTRDEIPHPHVDDIVRPGDRTGGQAPARDTTAIPVRPTEPIDLPG